MVPFSLLDLSPILQGGDASGALRNSLDLAQHAERWGYKRYWVAEHHNMPGIASAATSVVVGYIAGGTSTIRVGAGGIMLPNHSPLVIAEQFGTLASLYPGRIDLGLGRAPGTDRLTAHALRRDQSGGDTFPHDVVELQSYFDAAGPGQIVRAIPGVGLNVPIWLLGSSLFSAQLAAALGLPFAFASHFAPADLLPALEIYRERFQPSAALDRPYAMAAFGIFAAESDAEAHYLFTSAEQQFINLRRGRPGPLHPPVNDMDDYASAPERAQVREALQYSIVGNRETVRAGVDRFIALTGVDEILVTAQIYDHAARLRSFGILADVCKTEMAA
ncbi:MAG: LLM class flavin-dependent oxidoreductase, partial [Candidatus Eremiobacteraeota bacterium]|nr:LLM class flavin-dependent oxidoreductase [Candidatus Eremiobacteraeota bacterium]